jgi:hypothetical protein
MFEILHCSTLFKCKIFSFLGSQEYKVFRVEILHVGRIHHNQHLGFVFRNFEVQCLNFSKNELHGA